MFFFKKAIILEEPGIQQCVKYKRIEEDCIGQNEQGMRGNKTYFRETYNIHLLGSEFSSQVWIMLLSKKSPVNNLDIQPVYKTETNRGF